MIKEYSVEYKCEGKLMGIYMLGKSIIAVCERLEKNEINQKTKIEIVKVELLNR